MISTLLDTSYTSVDYLSSGAERFNIGIMTITEMLAKGLEKSGEPQATMARRLGISPQTFNALLKGDIKVPTADVRRKLAAAFNLRHVDILVMVGEIATDEIDSRPTMFPYDSERAILTSLVPKLDETDARIVRKTVQAIIDERDAQKVADIDRLTHVPA